MKKLFQSHIPDSEQEIKRVWKDALIVFDANTILNLYRYSDKSRSEFIALLNSLKQRIWTPEQAAHEYFKNRSVVIGDQTKAYDAAKKSINDLRDALRKDRGHPFIEEPTMDSLLLILKKVESELDKNKENQISRISSDDIMTEIVNIFDGRVGEKLSIEIYEEIFVEGAERYEQKVPPGYRDGTKHENPTTFAEKRSVFGDLVLWKQTITKAKELTKPIIFVTDDAKDDWWLEAQGKTIGPRIELLDEFQEQVGQKLYMYRPDQFLKHAKEQLHSDVSRETIDEIRATDEIRVLKDAEYALINLNRNQLMLKKERNRLAHIAHGVEREPDIHYENALSRLRRNRPAVTHDLSWADLNAYQLEHEVAQDQIEEIRKELSYLANKFSKVRAPEDFDADEIEFLMERRQKLESSLLSKQQELKRLREKIEFEKTLLTAFKPNSEE
jgi:hypothetical protein